MVIYADVLWIVNLYIDYFILLWVKDFLNLNVRNFRIIIASIVGASFSLILIANLSTTANVVLSFLCAIIICFTAFYNKSFIFLIKPFFCFIAASFVFGGVILLLSNFTGMAALVNGIPYFQISPILLFFFTVVSFFIAKFLQKIIGKYESKLSFYKIVVEHAGASVELFTKGDTANNLKEPFSGLPVIVVEEETASILRFENETNFRLVPFNSLGGTGLLHAHKPNKIYIKKDGTIINAYLAIYKGKLSAGTYNSLINPNTVDTLNNKYL